MGTTGSRKIICKKLAALNMCKNWMVKIHIAIGSYIPQKNILSFFLYFKEEIKLVPPIYHNINSNLVGNIIQQI